MNEKCPKCDVPLDLGMAVHNNLEDCRRCITFPYMKIGESMHLECYIERVIDEHFKHKIETPPNP